MPVLAHQRVGQLGQRRPAVAGARLEPRGVELAPCAAPPPPASPRASRRGTSRTPAAAGRPRCRRCRRTACCGPPCIDRLRLAERLAADGARVLERDRVALLRHDAAALHEAVAEPQVVELRRAPEQQVLHEAPDARRAARSAADGALEQVVDGGDAAVGVAGRCRRSRADRAVRCRSIGKPVPVMAQAPSGLRLVRSYAPLQPRSRRARAAR